MEPFLTREYKPSWTFTWDDEYNGYIHKTHKKGIYKIFFSNCNDKPVYDWESPDIWIGKLVNDGDGKHCWIPVEKKIKAKTLLLQRGYFTFL